MPNAVPSRADYFARWSKSHGGYAPEHSPLVRGWLTLVYGCARPLAVLRVPPDAVTLLGLLVAVGGALAARAGGAAWLCLAAFLVVLSGLSDSLDGAVAVLADRSTAFGYVLDSLADRCADLSYLVALWWAGAPAAVCVWAGAVMMLHEYLRARATAGGMTDIGVVTVWERPTRVIVTAAFVLAAAVYHDPVGFAIMGDRVYTHTSWRNSSWWASFGAWVWLGLGVVGFAQLAVVVRRRLR